MPWEGQGARGRGEGQGVRVTKTYTRGPGERSALGGTGVKGRVRGTG